MFQYFLRRLLFLIPTLYVVVTVVFFLVHFIPGDPVDFILGERALPAERENLVKKLHLDDPLWVQHSQFIANLFHGDLGRSLYDGESVVQKIGGRFGATLRLALAALCVSLSLAIPLGLYAALRKDRFADYGAMFFALLGISIPNFYLGPLLILFFSIYLGIFPVSGDQSWGAIVLPALTLGTSLAAMVSRMTRASLLEVLRSDYIRTARAKGVSAAQVVLKHGFRSALLPVVTVVGLQFGALMAGTVVTEKVFNWPGLGTLMLQGIERRDYPIVQGCVLTIAFLFILVNLLTDLLYAYLDPRVQLGSGTRESL